MLLVVLSLAGSLSLALALKRAVAPLPPVLSAVPDFRFAEARGGEVTGGSLRGRVWVADFIFTTCGSACPRMSAEMAKLQRETSDLPSVALVSFSLDPERDTPERLVAHAEEFGADPSRWRFLLGPDPEIQRLARETFFLATTPGNPAAGEERIIHSDRFVLVDAEGNLRGTYSSSDESAMQRLRRDLRRLAGG